MSLLFQVWTPPFAWEDGRITLCISLGSGCRCSADWEALLEMLGPARHPVSRARPGHARSGPESPPALLRRFGGISTWRSHVRTGRDGGWSARARLSTEACRGSDAAPQLHLGVDARAYEKGCGAILLRDGQAGGPSAREGAACGAGGRRAFYLSARTSRRRGGFGG